MVLVDLSEALNLQLKVVGLKLHFKEKNITPQ